MSLLSAQEIALAVQGDVLGDPEQSVHGAAGLEEATEKQLSFFHHVKYAEALAKTRAGVVLVPPQVAHQIPPGRTWIRVKDPQWAFALVLGMLYKNQQRHPVGIHPKSEIDPSARIAPGASIGAFTVVEAGAEVGAGAIIYAGCYIGARCRVGEGALIYPQVVLREDTLIGRRAIIHSGSVLGADGYGFSFQNGHHQKIPQIGQVVIEDDVEIGANVTIDRATTGDTRVGAGTKIDNLVHLAHNVQIGKDCLIVACVGISGSTKVGNNVTLAGQVGVAGHVKIGDGATIMAQSGIFRDVEPGAVMFGSPARPRKLAMKLEALYGRLPELYEALKETKRERDA